jgi:hypothetical protein
VVISSPHHIVSTADEAECDVVRLGAIPMAARPPLPTSGRKIARGAVMIAIAALQDERVRAQLGRAPYGLSLL